MIIIVLAPGSLVADKYRIERVLGSGGMGVVLAATHEQLGVPVALKVLNDELAKQPQILERFLREARAAAALRSEHVCRVTDVGTSDDAPFMVMELLEGRDLARVLAVDGPLSVALAADYLLQACVGIAEAHALGIVHRDLKPGNLFVTARGDGSPLVKVLDFGIAKAPSTRGASELTSSLHVIGSPGYMSPEQIRSSRAVDARSDIWSLGVTLYELVSGRAPFTAINAGELAVMITNDPTPPLPGDHRELDDVIAACLQKDPEQRFADVAAFAAALEPFAPAVARRPAAIAKRLLEGGESVTMRRPAVAPQSATVPGSPGSEMATTTLRGASGVVEAVTVPLPPRPRRRGRSIIFASAVVVGLGVGVVASMVRKGDGPRQPAHDQVAPEPPAPAMVAPVTPAPAPALAQPEAQPDAGVIDAPAPPVRRAQPRPTGKAPADAPDSFENSRI